MPETKADLQQENERLQNELAAARDRSSSLEKTVAEKEREADALRRELRSTERLELDVRRKLEVVREERQQLFEALQKLRALAMSENGHAVLQAEDS